MLDTRASFGLSKNDVHSNSLKEFIYRFSVQLITVIMKTVLRDNITYHDQIYSRFYFPREKRLFCDLKGCSVT